MYKKFFFAQNKKRNKKQERERHLFMKEKICFITLLTIGILTVLVIFFEKRENQMTDVFDGVLVYEKNIENKVS